MKTAGLLLLAAMLPAAELRIDHVTIAGRDLASMQTRLEAAGFKVESGGPHSNHATQMAIVSFPDGSYLELIALQPGYDAAALAQHHWAKFIEGDAGPAAWAVRPKDFAAEVARLKSTGLPVLAQASGRKRPDGVALEWETAAIGSMPSGTFFPFLIRDITARDQRAYPSGKPGNRDQSGILRVVIAVSKLSDAIDSFRQAYPDSGRPLKEVDRKFGAEVAWFPDSPVIFAAPLGATTRIAQRIEKFGEGPCAFVLGEKKARKRDASLTSRWFGRDIQWLEPDQLGWWLGLERQ